MFTSPPGALVTLGTLMQSATYPAFLTALNSTRYGSQTLANMMNERGTVTPPSPFFTPQQLHLSYSSSPPALTLTWVTTSPLPPTCTPTLSFWPLSEGGTNVSTSPATQYTYSAGVAGWHGALYTATTSPLLPNVQYQYSVGGAGAYSNASGGGGECGPFSQPRVTTLPPPPGSPTAYLALTADMGTIVPLGWAVADRLIQDHFESGRPFDALVVGGDLAYATVEPSSCSPTNPGCDEVEWTWDAFGLQLEPITTSVVQMNSVGNHEHVPGNITMAAGGGGGGGGTRSSAFAAFEARYPQAASGYGGSPPYWWATDVGPLHLQFISTEHPFDQGTPQWAWIGEDLGRVNRGLTPWVVTVMHRPIYSAAVLEWEDHSPGGKLSLALEPLLHGGGVDLVVSGHIHSLDRTHPVWNGTVTSRPLPPPSSPNNSTTPDTYAHPTSPIFLCQGTSGALPENVFFDPPPTWSASRILGSFGYGRLAATPGELKYEFVSMVGTVMDSFIIQK